MNRRERKIGLLEKALVTVLVISAFYSCRQDDAVIVPEPALPAVVSFHQHILPLFHANCALSGCHNGLNPNVHLNLTDSVAYKQLFVKHEIDTINPSNSFLYQQMTSTGTPMPPTGKLSDYDIKLVLKWLNEKAPDN
jgi:hypothetical protein